MFPIVSTISTYISNQRQDRSFGALSFVEGLANVCTCSVWTELVSAVCLYFFTVQWQFVFKLAFHSKAGSFAPHPQFIFLSAVFLCEWGVHHLGLTTGILMHRLLLPVRWHFANMVMGNMAKSQTKLWDAKNGHVYSEGSRVTCRPTDMICEPLQVVVA